jgi:isopenicillin N synthase-like dioxygenase
MTDETKSSALEKTLAEARMRDLAEGYLDPDGNPTTLDQLVRDQPTWARNVIRSLKVKLEGKEKHGELLLMHLAVAEENIQALTDHARRWEDKAEEYRANAIKFRDEVTAARDRLLQVIGAADDTEAMSLVELINCAIEAWT